MMEKWSTANISTVISSFHYSIIPASYISMIKGKTFYNFKEVSADLSAVNNLIVTFSMEPEATTSITLPCLS